MEKMEIKRLKWREAAIQCSITNGTKFYDAGEAEPFASMSKASMARVMEAVIKTCSKIHCTHTLDEDYNRSSVCYRVEVPIGMEKTFEKISKTKLTEPPRVSVN